MEYHPEIGVFNNISCRSIPEFIKQTAGNRALRDFGH